jgi:hypothetical protein
MLKSQIHSRAVEAARRYRACEVELIEAIQEVMKHKVYLLYGASSVFNYVTGVLGLSTEVAYIYIGVAGKALEVPELKQEIAVGRITVSKARRLVSVIDRSNKDHWLELAATRSKQQLEKEIAIANPKLAIRDKLNYSADPVERVSLKRRIARVQFQAGVSEDVMLKIRKVQDVMSQKKRASVGFEAMLDELADYWLKREDPVEKAKRSKIRGERKNSKTLAPGSAELVDSESRDIADRESEAAENPALENVANSESKRLTNAAPESPTATQARRKLCPGTVYEMRASNSRAPLNAKTKHEVNLKFKGQCSYKFNGRRCGQRRFLHIHHIKPVSEGGTNDTENLELLCSGHHKVRHLKDHRH